MTKAEQLEDLKSGDILKWGNKSVFPVVDVTKLYVLIVNPSNNTVLAYTKKSIIDNTEWQLPRRLNVVEQKAVDLLRSVGITVTY